MHDQNLIKTGLEQNHAVGQGHLYLDKDYHRIHLLDGFGGMVMQEDML